MNSFLQNFSAQISVVSTIVSLATKSRLSKMGTLSCCSTCVAIRILNRNWHVFPPIVDIGLELTCRLDVWWPNGVVLCPMFTLVTWLRQFSPWLQGPKTRRKQLSYSTYLGSRGNSFATASRWVISCRIVWPMFSVSSGRVIIRTEEL